MNQRRFYLLAAAAALLMVVGFAAPSANGALITYFNFNDNNLVSDPPGLQTSTITNNTPTRLTTSFVTGTTLNQASGDLTGAGSALEVSATANGLKTFSFTVNTTFFVDLSLSFATRGNLSPYTISYTTSGGGSGTIGTVTLNSTTTYQLASFDVSAINNLEQQSSVTFTFTFPNGNGSFADFDNIQLNGTAVPEPASVTGAALAAIGICWRQRRRIPGIGRMFRIRRKTAA